MARVKSPAQRAHKSLKRATKGFKQARRTRIKAGKEALLHAGQYSYHGRKLKKRNLRSLWILRLNIAAREHGLTYNNLISQLKNKRVEIDRKILADIAVSDPNTFKEIISQLK
jgi:large subunit ribosomal protein L20